MKSKTFSTGRFLNADDNETILYNSCNLFLYCNNNPVNRVDFNGYWYYTLSGYYKAKLSKCYNAYMQINFKSNYKKLENRYNKNKKLWNGYNYFINGQKRGNIGKMVLGSNKVADVGCEAIAIYNAMKRKGKSVTLYIILSEIEMNSLTWFDLGGCLGVNPKDIYKYLKAHKMSYKKYTSFSSFEKAAKNKKKTCIVGFKLKNSNFKVHTVALYWNGSKWIVYNRFNNSEGTESYSKLSDLTSSKKFIVGYVM